MCVCVCVCVSETQRDRQIKTEKTGSVTGIHEAQSPEPLWSLEQWKIHFIYVVTQKLEVAKHRELTVLETQQGTKGKGSGGLSRLPTLFSWGKWRGPSSHLFPGNLTAGDSVLLSILTNYTPLSGELRSLHFQNEWLTSQNLWVI